jgi:uncharacterized protein (DUF433 family)
MNYISLDEQGTARVNGTGIKVRILAEELRAGYRPEDIQEAHVELSMAQIHAALAYYYANKEYFDEEIESGRSMLIGTGDPTARLMAQWIEEDSTEDTEELQRRKAEWKKLKANLDENRVSLPVPKV